MAEHPLPLQVPNYHECQIQVPYFPAHKMHGDFFGKKLKKKRK
jgi:hypothetical protein